MLTVCDTRIFLGFFSGDVRSPCNSVKFCICYTNSPTQPNKDHSRSECTGPKVTSVRLSRFVSLIANGTPSLLSDCADREPSDRILSCDQDPTTLVHVPSPRRQPTPRKASTKLTRSAQGLFFRF